MNGSEAAKGTKAEAATATALDGRIQMLEAQRNEALNRCVLLCGQIAELQKRISELEAPSKEPAAPNADARMP